MLIIFISLIAFSYSLKEGQQQNQLKQQTLVSQGPLFNVYNPSVGEDSSWYLNDHTFIYGPGDMWHVIGIWIVFNCFVIC
jgi:hypothetical protein